MFGMAIVWGPLLLEVNVLCHLACVKTMGVTVSIRCAYTNEQTGRLEGDGRSHVMGQKNEYDKEVQSECLEQGITFSCVR